MKEQKEVKPIFRNHGIRPKHDGGCLLRTRRSLSAWPSLERRRRAGPTTHGMNNIEHKAKYPASPGRSAIASSVLVSSSCVDTVLAGETCISIRQYIYHNTLSRGQPSFLYHLLILMISCFSYRKPSSKGSQRMKILMKSKNLHHWFIFRVCGNTLYMHQAHQLLQE